MRIAILSVGSHGDVHPYVALGRGLQSAGFDVRIVTHAMFEQFVRAYGLDMFPLESNPLRDLVVPSDLADFARQNTMSGLARALGYHLASWSRLSVKDGLGGFEGVDAIVYSLPAIHGAYIAEGLGVPAIGAFLYPTLERPNLDPSLGPVTRGVARAMHWRFRRSFERTCWQEMRATVNDYRKRVLNLPPLGSSEGPWSYMWRRRIPILYGVSPRIFPTWARVEDWCRVTGYWFIDNPLEWEPPHALREFLEAGTPPIFISFGSMIYADVDKVRRIVLEVLERTGQRAIVQVGWQGLTFDEGEPRVFPLQWAPYEKLLPLVALMVNHGGQGTVASALRVGIPQIVVPFSAEQHMWGLRLEELGLGVRPVPFEGLTVEALSSAISQVVGDDAMKGRVREIGAAIRQEDGVGETVRFITEYLGARA